MKGMSLADGAGSSKMEPFHRILEDGLPCFSIFGRDILPRSQVLVFIHWPTGGIAVCG